MCSLCVSTGEGELNAEGGAGITHIRGVSLSGRPRRAWSRRPSRTLGAGVGQLEGSEEGPRMEPLFSMVSKETSARVAMPPREVPRSPVRGAIV